MKTRHMIFALLAAAAVRAPLRAADARFGELVGLGAAIAADYEGRDDPWSGSPFGWLKRRPSRQVGAIGELLIERWLQTNGVPVVRPPDSDADRIVAGHRAEIKLSTLWATGHYKFQQLRDQDYEFAILMGISPHDAHCWVIPKPDLIRLWKVEHAISAQHNSGHGGTDTAWMDVDPANPPEWLRPFGGTLDQALEIIRRLVAPPEGQEAPAGRADPPDPAAAPLREAA